MSNALQVAQLPKRALIVIDVQNEYFSGKLKIEYPDPNISIHNIGSAMDAARAADMPILVVQHTAAVGAPIFQKGQPAWELHEVVKSRAFDHLVEKDMASIFTGTDVTAWLKQNEIDTLSIVGYMTHNCNAATIYQASHDGYRVEMLSDASGALPYKNTAGSATAEEIHRIFSVVFHSNFAAVINTVDWIAAVEQEAALMPSNIVASNQNAISG
jgi:nicotinamidase-related amidase